MSASSGSEPVAARLESRFPLWLQGILDPRLHGAVSNGGDSQGSQFAILFRDKHTSDWTGPPYLSVLQVSDEAHAGSRCSDHYLINAGRVFAGIELRHPTHALERIAVAA